MYSFTSDSKFLIITDTDSGEVWRLEKNQVSLKHINELVIIDRNGMHYKNVLMKVDSVNGVAPTSISDLRTKILALL